MTQPDGAKAEGFDGAHVTAAFDVFTNAEGVVEHEEHPAEHILDQRLRTEADGNAEDAGPGNQRGDLDPEPDSTVSTATTAMKTARRVAEYRQQRAQSGAARHFVGLAPSFVSAISSL